MYLDIPARRTLIGTALAGLLLSSCTTTDLALRNTTPVLASGPQDPAEAQAEENMSARQLSAAITASAPTNGSPLTLEQAVHTALNWHPSIDEAVGRINQHTAEIGVARAGYYPKVQGGIGPSYTSDAGGEWQPSLNVSASQMIYDFGKVSSSVEARTASANVSRSQLLLGVDTLIRDTANAVIEIQRYRALLGVAQEQLRGVKTIADLVRQRSDKGASTKSDEVQADARVVAAQSTVLEITGQLQRWESTLANLLGRSGPVNVASIVPPWLSKSCEASAPDWSEAPAVLQAEARKTEALAQLNLSRAQAFPTLSLEAGGEYYFNQGSSDESEFKVGLNVSGNLYDGGASAANREAAKHALDAADAAIRNSQLEISSALTQARSQTSSLQQLLASLNTRSGMMRQTRDLYRQQYVELGTRTLLDLLNAEQELHQAAFDSANSTHDLRGLGVECMFNSGHSRNLFALDRVKIRGVELQL